ncbi:CheY-like chemotaxis protein [Streptomyces sp. V4I2]|nr:CheY-like chemotaxis protein [Streptomyces sp. V4I2]
MIRVLLVDDQPLLRSGFRALLDLEDDIEVVAEAADGEEALVLTEEHLPDIVLIDIQMPVVDGIEATRRIAADPALCRGTRRHPDQLRLRRVRLRRTARRRSRVPRQGHRAGGLPPCRTRRRAR